MPMIEVITIQRPQTFRLARVCKLLLGKSQLGTKSASVSTNGIIYLKLCNT